MIRSTFDEIKIVDDSADDINIIKNIIINTEDQERAFYIADIGNVLRKHQEWITKMPKVIPYFGMYIFYSYILIIIYLYGVIKL